MAGFQFYGFPHDAATVAVNFANSSPIPFCLFRDEVPWEGSPDFRSGIGTIQDIVIPLYWSIQ
jgi:hypothetical protein